jgi:N-acetylglucosaminyldiphosphoundecaprenol N-acetyl-beta-D-mannosaminyltransferase
MKTTKILQTNISETTLHEVSTILNKSYGNKIAICNANTLVRSARDIKIRNIVNNFTIKTPDGFPVAKALSFFCKKNFSRVDGYKVLTNTVKQGVEFGTKHYFFGNSESTTKLLIKNLKLKYPGSIIVGYICPERLSAEELVSKYKKILNKIEADIVWVSLGFPKQEIFIDQLFKEADITKNYVGIGGVFDWVAGTKKKAPEWVANLGLEWFLRFIQEPRRLYKRYLIDNTLFIFYFLRQVFFKR